MARHLVHAPFLKGDVVTRQGAVAHWLYLVIDGTAEICDETGGTRRYVSSLGPGDIFGERGMLTGEPRSSTVVATTDLECYRLDKAGLAGVLRERPDIAEHMSNILAQRVAELDRLRPRPPEHTPRRPREPICWRAFAPSLDWTRKPA